MKFYATKFPLFMKKKKKPICLITGSSGLIGSEVSYFFLKKKFNVIGIDNNFRKFFFW